MAASRSFGLFGTMGGNRNGATSAPGKSSGMRKRPWRDGWDGAIWLLLEGGTEAPSWAKPVEAAIAPQMQAASTALSQQRTTLYFMPPFRLEAKEAAPIGNIGKR
jgi:hypothetical protein